MSGRCSVCVTAIVTGSGPQSNVMMPPAVTAASSAANGQLAAVPVPTTVVGCDTSTGMPAAGTPAPHIPSGLPLGSMAVVASVVEEASTLSCVPDDEPHAHNVASTIESLIRAWSQAG